MRPRYRKFGAAVETLESRRMLCVEHRAVAGLPDVANISDTARQAIMGAVEVAVRGGVASSAFWQQVDAPGWTSTRQRPVVQALEMETFSFDFDKLWNRVRDARNESQPDGTKRAVQIELPSPTGVMSRFMVEKTQVMAPALAAKFPQIQTFRGRGVDDPSADAYFTLSPVGFIGQVLSPAGSWTVEPLQHLNQSVYASYFNAYAVGVGGAVNSAALPSSLELSEPVTPNQSLATGQFKRHYRLAVSAAGEFTQFWGNTVAQAMSGLVSLISLVDGVYERELGISLDLVANNDQLIFTNPATDPFTRNSSTNLQQNQTLLDSVIGDANYDIGHHLSTGNEGVASAAGNVGQPGQKARGVSWITLSSVQKSIEIICHEMGHQFGANHTFNSPNFGNQWVQSTAVEPGNGSTIMAYGAAGGADSFQNYSSLYFNSASLAEINAYTSSGPGLPFNQTATGNLPPVVNAGADFTIPRGTPYFLRGTVTDTPGQTLTWSWEQQDVGPAAPLNSTSTEFGPLVRSRLQSRGETAYGASQFGDFSRAIPSIPTILSGTTVSNPEKLANVTRTMTFDLTARDQLGGVATDRMSINVDGAIGPFAITSANSAVTWIGGTTQTITWDVAGTNMASVGGQNVDILWSADGGATFSPLVSNTPNDGSQSITVPFGVTLNGRIMIKARDGIFFDINNAPIKVGDQTVSGALPLTFAAASAEGYLFVNEFGDSGDVQAGANAFIDTTGDTDGYLFAPPVSGRYTFDAAKVGASTVDTVLGLYNAATGAMIAVNDDLGPANLNSRLSVDLTAGTLYCVVVGDFGSNSVGDVSITINGDVDQRLAQPIPLDRLGQASPAGLLFTSPTQTAYFQFVAPANAAGSFEVLTGTGPDLDLYLYDAAGNLLAQGNQRGAGQVESVSIGGVTAGAVYTLAVVAARYATSGAYAIHADFDTINATVTGAAYNDLNMNGVRDAGEPGLASVQIYADLNENGVYDSGAEPTWFTGSTGTYTLINVPPGPVQVRVVVPANYIATSPAAGTPIVVTGVPGTTIPNINFGMYLGASDRGRVWNDLDGDGIEDSGEPGLAGWTVYLDAPGAGNGVFDSGEQSTLTDASGNWQMTGIPVGAKTVRVVLQQGYLQTVPTSNNGYFTNYQSGQTLSNANFGVQLGMDFGDAPASYGTLLADDGARHRFSTNLRLFQAPDVEPDGIPSADARGDNLTGIDDENGIEFITALNPGATFRISVSWGAAAGGVIQGWIDFNRDGDFLDAGEQFLTRTVGSGSGAFVNTSTVPAGASLGYTYARFRISATGGLGPTGFGGDGEVEDYRILIGTLPAAPSKPTLTAASDTGASNTDGITRIQTPTFTGTAGANLQVKLYAGTTLLASTTADASGNWTATTSLLSDGTYDIYAVATNGAGDSSPSQTTRVVIDTVRPTASFSGFLFETGHNVRFTFSEPVDVATLEGADLVVDPASPGAPNIPGSTVGYDSATRVATFGFAGLLGDDNYAASLQVNGVQDVAGNGLASSPAGNFFVLAGDADRDRSVNIADFSILASRFNLPGTFSQGDFNYNGTTEIGDFSILASKFNSNLPAARSAAAALPQRALNAPASVPRARGGASASTVSAPRPAFGASLMEDKELLGSPSADEPCLSRERGH